MYIIAGPITPLLGICPMDLCDYEKKVQRYSLLNLEGGKKTLEITCPFIEYLLYKLQYIQLLKQM